MKETLKDKLDSIVYILTQLAKAIITIIFAPLFLVLAILKVIIHPVIWAWTFFQCKFLIDYYIKRKYDNEKYENLVRLNINFNYPSRQKPTLRNKIFRWCLFKVFKKNNYTYDPERKSSWTK